MKPITSRPSDRNQERGKAAHWSFTIGSIFGICLRIHATFLFLLAWVAFSHFAQGHELRVAIEGLSLVLAVFGIVVLHELGHALTARRFGIRTRDITLLPIGGVARLERMPEKPSQELLVAVAGPMVNVSLALVLAGVVVLTGGTLNIDDTHVVGGPLLTKLMWINVSLAMFNLLPAFPMDGGRVLRATLAMRMDYARATKLAARIGQGMAALFGVLGLLYNPMLSLIALFVWVSAGQESVLVQLKSAINDVLVGNAMITEFRTLLPEDTLARAAEIIVAGFQHDFPVVDGDQVVGVLTREDVVKGLADSGSSTPVARFMRRDFVAAAPDESLESSLGRMRERESPSLMVVEAGRVVGILTPENVGELIALRGALQGVPG